MIRSVLFVEFRGRGQGLVGDVTMEDQNDVEVLDACGLCREIFVWWVAVYKRVGYAGGGGPKHLHS
jgi:hypothetical protein